MTDAHSGADQPSDAALVARLVDLLDLEPIEQNLFRGPITSEPWVRVFGGQVVGQALMAASRTVEPTRLAHSLHAYFMRPGNPHRPIVYEVFRDRDGGSFTSRRVVAIQDGQPILNLAAGFAVAEAGLAHQSAMPDVPPPEGLIDDHVRTLREVERIPAKRRPLLLSRRPMTFRQAAEIGRTSAGGPASVAYWFRTVAPLPDDQVLHRGLLAYASDMMLLSTSLRAHAMTWFSDERMQEASLDHALWIHEDVRLDEWLLYVMDSPWTGHARGMSRGTIFTRDGRLVASVAQEGLIRLRDT